MKLSMLMPPKISGTAEPSASSKPSTESFNLHRGREGVPGVGPNGESSGTFLVRFIREKN
jgi:hypothetical protein